MSMFDKYDYPIKPIPDNSTPKSNDTYHFMNDEAVLPRKVYNIKNNFIGYEWSYGDTFTFCLSTVEKIKIKEDSIVYQNFGECPDTSTVGYPGQQAYNVSSCTSWTCIGVYDGLFIWIKDDVVIYPDDGTLEIDLTPCAKDCELEVTIYNFRWEPIHTFKQLGANEISCVVNKEVSEDLVPGVYYCTFRVTCGSASYIKDKFMFIVD